MFILISPAKTLDENAPNHAALKQFEPTQPQFMTEAEELVKILKQKSIAEIAALMKISTPLAELNHKRFQNFSAPFQASNATPAIFSFKGDVYLPLRLNEYGATEIAFMNAHLRILSGLYGLLRPLDWLYPYRLEMGTGLHIGKWRNLYQFWGDKITDEINKQAPNVIINLASEEYFKVVQGGAAQPNRLCAPLLNITFKERKGDDYKVIGIHAKAARGEMLNFIVQNSITKVQELQGFNVNGYNFAPQLSSPSNYVFVR